MHTRKQKRPVFLRIALLVFSLRLMTGAIAQQFILQGSATQTGPSTYRLTPDVTNQAGMVTNYYPIDLSTGATITFELNFGTNDANGADGCAFMLSNTCNPVLVAGGGLGVQNTPNSLVVDFDTYYNSTMNDIPDDHTGIYANGNFSAAGNIMDGGPTPVCLLPGCGNVEDGQWHLVVIEWDPLSAVSQRVSVYFDGNLRATSTQNHIANLFNGSNIVFWSVAASTGALSNLQQFRVSSSNNSLTVCEGAPFTLTAPALGSNYSWTANPSTTNTANYIATTSGVYSCNFTNYCGLSQTVSFNVTVNQLATPTLSGNGPICEGNDAVFTITGSPGLIVSYSINGGPTQTVTIGPGGTCTVTVPAPAADQSIQLTHIDDGTCNKDIDVRTTVVVNPLPAAPTLATNSPVCSGNDAIFTITGTPGNSVSYSINGGPVQTVTIAPGGTATVTVPGATSNQTMLLSDITDGTCNRPINISSTITVNPMPSTPSLTGNGPICRGSDAVFTITGAAGDIISYALNGGPVQTLTIGPGGTGTVTVTAAPADQLIRVSDVNNGLCNLAVDLRDTIKTKLPPLAPAVSGNGPVCFNHDAVFTITGLAGEIISYSINGAPVQTIPIGAAGNAMVTVPSITTDQTLQVIQVDNGYCTRIFNITQTVSFLPTSSSVVDTTICSGQNYAGYNSGGTYVDVFPGSNGCDSTRTLHLTVVRIQRPNLGGDRVICPGETIKLTPGAFNGYLWQDGSSQPTYSVTTPGIYNVTVYAPCGNLRDQVLVKTGICDVYFPSAFTPDNDGKNDFFKVLSTLPLTEFSLKVFNRWGQVIFETHDTGKGWDGTFRGLALDPGSFVWTASYTFKGEKKFRKGSVMLIR